MSEKISEDHVEIFGSNATDRITLYDNKSAVWNFTFFEINNVKNLTKESYTLKADGILGLGYDVPVESKAIALV
jgi:hypothetical protein